MEFGNDYLRQQQIAGWGNHIFKNACRDGITKDQATMIAEAVIYHANTNQLDEEPSEAFVDRIMEHYRQFFKGNMMGLPP